MGSLIDSLSALYLPALVGGVLIGLAATILLLGNGRIAGVSGIFWNAIQSLVKLDMTNAFWRICFILGLVVGPMIAHQLVGIDIPQPPEGSTMLAIVAGLCVGFGTRLGSGCTSGHGICGTARFSTRSIVATITFMVAGFVTVFIVRHLI